ncbi:phospholipid/cholesterol/gamma-HCH transport system substrate-binding protein [Nocardia bhagyanarayanae]|uniref:Phospholipid/cholesterol/gamma-HCH transport system substrate-binding protein n=1 Tax=Nocardia bhagyanarayanae TaxID=1215925 RepID=A0A543FHY8_9NOCA|nr:MCE family protein [Nocardia bhagyanarayanae]TQM33324.1 phospholipid/cholesterol/gamma-HCH transport system substrate-binding protein [Nocardia bhagyanarayanae]
MDARQQSSRGRFPILWATWAVVRLKVAGLAFVSMIAVVALLAMSMYAGRFESTATVFVDAPRSGLVLDPDAAVRMRGVEIGRVAAVEPHADRVRLRLELDPELLRMVPENALVDIRSTTVFGAKYVHFVSPAAPSPRSLAPGALVRAESVTVEFNTLFQRLSTVLAKVEPGQLNATLAALSAALQSRGELLGDLLARADATLRLLNPSLPQLGRDMAATAEVTDVYADTAGELLRTVDNATVTGATVADRAADLDEMLLNVVGLAETTRAVLTESEQPLATAVRLLRPGSALLNEYRPALRCVITGIASVMPLAEAIFGGMVPGAVFNTNFMLASEPYQYPEDLPKVNATGGPDCSGIDQRTPGAHADYVVTDTSEGALFVPSTSARLHADPPTVFEIFFAGLPGVARR